MIDHTRCNSLLCIQSHGVELGGAMPQLESKLDFEKRTLNLWCLQQSPQDASFLQLAECGRETNGTVVIDVFRGLTMC